MIAAKPREWERHLKSLLGSEDYRRELSEAGREVAADLTIEANAWRWLEAWSESTKQTPDGLR